MNCHLCKNLVYSGTSYGRCVHPEHGDVVFTFRKDRKGKGSRTRPYNKTKCPDFCMIMKCSSCAYWQRGSYHRDGKTPSCKGKCAIGMRSQDGNACQLWEKRTRKTDRALREGTLLTPDKENKPTPSTPLSISPSTPIPLLGIPQGNTRGTYRGLTLFGV